MAYKKIITAWLLMGLLAGCCKLSSSGHGCATAEERALEKITYPNQLPPAAPVPPPFPQPTPR